MPDLNQPNPPAPVPNPPAPASPAQVAPPAVAAPPAEDPEKLKLQLQIRELEKDIHKVKTSRTGTEEKLAALKKLLGADDGDDDPKALLARREEETRRARESAFAIELALARKLIGTGLSETDASLVINAAKTDARLRVDDGKVSGLDEVLETLKPTIEKLTVKPASAPAPPPTAPPSPPAPVPAGKPMDQQFANVKTFKDLSILGTKALMEFREKYPEQFNRLEMEHRQRFSRPHIAAPSTPAQH